MSKKTFDDLTKNLSDAEISQIITGKDKPIQGNVPADLTVHKNLMSSVSVTGGTSMAEAMSEALKKFPVKDKTYPNDSQFTNISDLEKSDHIETDPKFLKIIHVSPATLENISQEIAQSKLDKAIENNIPNNDNITLVVNKTELSPIDPETLNKYNALTVKGLQNK